MNDKRYRMNKMLTIIAAILVLLAAVAFGIMRLLAPPSTPPAYTEARPAIADDGYISQTETILINLPVDQYNTWSSNTPLEAILPGADGIPRVVRTEMIQGDWDAVGARRRVVLEDGHYAAEEVIENDKPGLFRYQVWGYTNFARFAVDYAVDEFRLEDVSGQTRVTWTYAYHKSSVFADLFLGNFVHNDWATYMRSVLELMKAESEKAVNG